MSKESGTVKVRILIAAATFGSGESREVGAIVTVSGDEAHRLVRRGMAELVKAPAKENTTKKTVAKEES